MRRVSGLELLRVLLRRVPRLRLLRRRLGRVSRLRLLRVWLRRPTIVTICLRRRWLMSVLRLCMIILATVRVHHRLRGSGRSIVDGRCGHVCDARMGARRWRRDHDATAIVSRIWTSHGRLWRVTAGRKVVTVVPGERRAIWNRGGSCRSAVAHLRREVSMLRVVLGRHHLSLLVAPRGRRVAFVVIVSIVSAGKVVWTFMFVGNAMLEVVSVACNTEEGQEAGLTYWWRVMRSCISAEEYS